MILLALEQSTGLHSAALLDDSRVLAETRRPTAHGDAATFFAGLQHLLASSARTWEQVDAFAVGLGPGSFSGLRLALAAAHGLAMPGNKPLFGLPSAEAAATQAATQTGCSTLVICGDGRRQRIWSGTFARTDGLFAIQDDWQLDTESEFAERLPAGAAVCTADWPALAPALRAATAGRAVTLIEEPVIPDAAMLGRLAHDRITRGLPSLPLVPIYLHPPVFVPPSFPATQETA